MAEAVVEHKPWSEKNIGKALHWQILDRRCVIVVPRCSFAGHEADLLAVTPDLRLIDFEIKISRSDLKADLQKDKWWESTMWFRDHVTKKRKAAHLNQRAHPPKVWKHYYVVPLEIWKDELFDSIPPASGVLTVSRAGREHWNRGGVVVDVVRRAKPAKDAYKISAEEAICIARLASVRMWEAFGTEAE